MKTLTVFLAALVTVGASAREARLIFTKAYNAVPNKVETFKAGSRWMPLPDYSDRKEWEDLTAQYREQLVRAGEKALDIEIKSITASEYLQYDKDHDRKFLQREAQYRSMLKTLTMAELAEGKGRFLPKLIDVMYYYCEKATWNFAEHVKYQKIKGGLPDPEDKTITLLSAIAGQFYAYAWYFFHEEFDKIYPNTSKILLRGIEKNILEPYLDKSKQRFGQGVGSCHWWMCFNLDPNDKNVYNQINNWNTYCNTYCLQAFLCTCQDQQKLNEAIAQATRSVDIFMDYVNYDGLCEEGTGYWYMAGKKAYDFAKTLYYASDGAFNVLKDEQLRNSGEWRSDICIGDGWSVDIADGFARGEDYPEDLYRMGKDTGSKKVADLALYLHAERRKDAFRQPVLTGDLFEQLEQLIYTHSLMEDERAAIDLYNGDFGAMRKGLRSGIASSYYPDGDCAYLRNGNGWMACGKGGDNGESHNHCDLGSGLLFIDDCPVLIDAGVSTYGPRFYEGKDMQYWNHRSEWHNTPSPNGAAQKVGRAFTTRDSRFDEKDNSYSTDIAPAYSKDKAKCEKWVRSWTLGKSELTVTDDFVLTERLAPDEINFLVQGDVSLPGDKVGDYTVKSGEILIAAHSFDNDRSVPVRMTYSGTLSPVRDIVKLRDPRFTKIWGEKVERVRFVSAPDAPLRGQYSFTLTRK